LDYLKKAYSQDELGFAGKSLEYQSRNGFKALIDGLYKEDWVVYLKNHLQGQRKS
jgi:hypothetical protein